MPSIDPKTIIHKLIVDHEFKPTKQKIRLFDRFENIGLIKYDAEPQA